MPSNNYTTEKIVGKDEKFDNTKYFIDNGVDVEKRRVMIDSDVEERSVGILIRGIMKMIDSDKAKPIDIYINSYGGSCYDGFALYDILTKCEYATIRTHAFGKCMSMAFVIFCAGDERYAFPRVSFMAHSVAENSVDGKLFEHKINTKELDRVQNEMIGILSERTNKTLAWWKKELEFKDQYYNKEQALNLGIVTSEGCDIK